MDDPRFITYHHSTYKKEMPRDKFYLPASVAEVWCRPGYQPTRPDKGYKLTVNDYPFHHIQYGGTNWSQVVNTPFKTDN